MPLRRSWKGQRSYCTKAGRYRQIRPPHLRPAPRVREIDRGPDLRKTLWPAAMTRPRHRPDTWPHRPPSAYAQITLANGGPFSNRASLVNDSLLGAAAFPGSRFSPRSAYAAATSGPKHRRCNVHNGLACDARGPTASLAASLHPRPGGQPSHPNALSLGCIPAVSLSGLSLLFLRPTERLAGSPDAVQDHGQLSGERDTCLAWA